MELRINRYHAKNNTLGFDERGTSAWVSVFDWKELFGDERAPLYVKLSCRVPSPFTMYSKMNVLNPDGELGKQRGLLTIPYEAIHKDFLIGRDSFCEVSKVDIENLRIAESITIVLSKENNTYWSTLERKRVEENLRLQNEIVFVKQRLFLFPESKDPVLADISDVISSNSKKSELFRIDAKTVFHFENLRTDEEQVLGLDNIGGLDEILNKLRSIIQIPMNHPEYYSRFGIERPKGLLLYGPPGNGKTTIAKAIAKSLGGASFIEVKMTEIWASHVGDGERKLEEYFREAEKIGNCVIFIDEIDSIAMKRKSDSPGYEITLIGTLLSLMDGLNSNSKVFVIGATNRRDSIDPAFRRPGRFDLEEEIPLPAKIEAREDILSKIVPIGNRALFETEVNQEYLHNLAEITIGYSGADMKQLYREAAMSAIRRSVNFDKDGKEIILTDLEHTLISASDFELARELTTPTPLRGLENSEKSVLWDDIIALDENKQKMEELHYLLDFFTSCKKLKKRPSFCNVLMTGSKGTGKHTFIYAFSKQFGYEIIKIDFLVLEAMGDISLAFQYITDMFLKARQIGKAILVLENLDKLINPQKYLPTIFNENEKISKFLKVFTLLLCENSALNESVIGYKKFGFHLNFDVESSIVINAICGKYGLSGKIWNCEDRVGEIISTIDELQIKAEYIRCDT